MQRKSFSSVNCTLAGALGPGGLHRPSSISYSNYHHKTMTTATATTSITSIANNFAADYGVINIDFVWTAENGITDYTDYARGSEPDTATTNVPAFSYISDADVERVTQLLMSVVDDSVWGVNNISEIGGNLSIDVSDTPVFEGQVTATSPVCIQY